MKLPVEFSSNLRVSVVVFFCIATAASGQENKTALILPPPVRLPVTSGLSGGTASNQIDPAEGLISVDISVIDKTGKPASGLSEKDFTLFDNDRQQKIVSFQAFDEAIPQPADSLEIVLVLDELSIGPDSANGATKLSNMGHELENFLRANGDVLEKPTIIYRIASDGLFAIPHASRDGNELAREIEQPALQRQIWSPSTISKDIHTILPTLKFVGSRPSRQNQAAWRNITQSLVALGSIAIEERRNSGRKLMFWLGNGWQITENPKATGFSDFSIELLTRLREARIHLWNASEMYDTSGNTVPSTDVNRQFAEGSKADSTDLRYLSLPVIATRSGGGTLNTIKDLAAGIGKRVREESSDYFLTLDPPRIGAVDEYHHLAIKIDKSGLTPHVFEDYYDEPVFYDQTPVTQPISVSYLQALIASTKKMSDAKLAHQLDSMRLTERLSSAKLAVLEKSVHGKKAREALQVLVDESVFLAPPDEEIVAAPPPEVSAQQQMISEAISYIQATIPHLPDLLATRTSVQYYARPANEDQTWKAAPPDQSLHAGETTKASIHFRQGKELIKEESVKKTPDMQGGQNPTNVGALGPILGAGLNKMAGMREAQQLKTTGAFGPILGTIMVALTGKAGELNWSRWEQGGNGRLAVFRYYVSQDTPFFSVGFCCLPIDNKSIPFVKSVPFHGEIAVDPSTGAIMRLTVQADLERRLPLERSDVMVEYRPVQGGSRTFTCPSRSVSISRQRRTMLIEEWGESFKIYAPFETLLNEMRFDKYHVFGSTSRVIPGFVMVPKNE